MSLIIPRAPRADREVRHRRSGYRANPQPVGLQSFIAYPGLKTGLNGVPEIMGLLPDDERTKAVIPDQFLAGLIDQLLLRTELEQPRGRKRFARLSLGKAPMI